MMKYFEWICFNLISIDWKYWNYYLGDNIRFNLPLAGVMIAHLVIAMIIIFWVIDYLMCRNLYRTGYEAGYTDGVVSKAVKLGKLKFGEAPHGIVVYDVGREEFSNEIETAFQEHKHNNA